MNTPPLLLAAVLLFWGWQTGHVLLGVLAGAMLESSRLTRARWSLAQADFNRLWNVCIVLFIGAGTFLLINEGTVSFNDFLANAGRRPEALKQAGRSTLVWFQWFPIIFLPFMLAQVFNERPQVGLATFSWWLRKQEARARGSNLPREQIDVAFPYLSVGLLAACATVERPRWFYAGLAALLGWALWAARPKRHSLAVWSACFSVVVAAGFGGHTGLVRLKTKLEEMNVSWFSHLAATGFDDKEARTKLGSIGAMKNSGRIVLRVRTDGRAPPELLREASYATFASANHGARAAAWNNPVARRDFGSVFSEPDSTTWKLLPRPARRTVIIAQYLRGGSGLLALPGGVAQLGELRVIELKTNQFGAAKVSGGPGLGIYEARYERGATFDSAFGDDDLRPFDDLEPALAVVAAELQLGRGMEPLEAMRRVREYFAGKFQYASYLTTAHLATSNETALARFLLRTRSGHCEYFATATALLLRQAGVPTRYAVGYSVQEGSGKKFIVRERHAHAWVLVWDERNWIDFDTTPGSWNAAESAHTSWFQPVSDFFSDLWFQFSKFRWGQTEWRKYFMLAPVPLLIIVIVRFVFGKQWRQRRAQKREQGRAARRAGGDSDFYLIEKHFAARGLERRPSENWSDWLRRIEEHERGAGQLQSVVMLHRRHRFDPRGLSGSERAELRAGVAQWLARRTEAPRPTG